MSLAQAVLKLFPKAKPAIGPAIDTGFYYDFDVEVPFTAEDLERIEKEMKDLNIKTIVTNNLEEALNNAKNDSISGDIVLLSPASASWDQYESFEVRGTEFKSLVNKL